MTDLIPLSDEDVEKRKRDDQFFCQDNITISVKSVYRSAYNPRNLDRITLITQLKEIAKARGYNVSESESHFTRTKYIHFKKYRLETPKEQEPLQLKDTPKPQDIVVDL